MDVVISAATEHILWQLDQCDNRFTVDAVLRLYTEADVIRYTVVPVPAVEKRYPPVAIDGMAYLRDPDKAIYFATCAGEPAGQLICSTHWNGYAYIEDIRVAGHYRRQGVARRLLQTAVEWARRRGLPGIMLETQNNNVAACRLYERFGFELKGFDRYLYKGLRPEMDEIALYWYLVW